MSIDPLAFRVRSSQSVSLRDWPTRVKPFYTSEKDYACLLERHVERLQGLQELHWASHTHALLLIFQGMDAAGKDGVIQHVMSGVNPAGCRVVSFKVPSAEESEHDFLWRSALQLPARGQIGIFNRSYYEEVLIVRVHPHLLRTEGFSQEVAHPKGLWKRRYQSIVALERHLHRSGTLILKFFLHMSKAEQRTRFLARIEDPERNWKFSLSDVEERRYWKDYTKAYEACLTATSGPHAPWYIVPADDKQNARLIVSQTIVSSLEGLKMTFPRVSPKRARELKAIARQL